MVAQPGLSQIAAGRFLADSYARLSSRLPAQRSSHPSPDPSLWRKRQPTTLPPASPSIGGSPGGPDRLLRDRRGVEYSDRSAIQRRRADQYGAAVRQCQRSGHRNGADSLGPGTHQLPRRRRRQHHQGHCRRDREDVSGHGGRERSDSRRGTAALQGASGLATIKIDNDATSVGDKVTAVGNAGGTGTLTAAKGTIVSLKASITTAAEGPVASETLTGMIETTADVVSGDSGGPLYDADGEAVGIDTAASSGPRSTATPLRSSALSASCNRSGQGRRAAQCRWGRRRFWASN
jgi:Trypsin-like peptidase domain